LYSMPHPTNNFPLIHRGSRHRYQFRT